MTEQALSRDPAALEKSAYDLLSRLYREIGVSAVAAALWSMPRAIESGPSDLLASKVMGQGLADTCALQP